MTNRADILRRAGPALYGRQWVTALADALGYSRTYIRAMVREDNPLPVSDEVMSRLARVLEERGAAIAELRVTLPVSARSGTHGQSH